MNSANSPISIRNQLKDNTIPFFEALREPKVISMISRNEMISTRYFAKNIQNVIETILYSDEPELVLQAYKIFHNNERYKKILTPIITKSLNVKYKKKKLYDPKQRIYRSLSSVCEVLSKASPGISMKNKIKENTLQPNKKDIIDSDENKKCLSFNSKEYSMTLDILQELEYQKIIIYVLKISN